VWGTSESDVWVVEQNLGSNSRPFLHWDGQKWTRDPSTTEGWGSVQSIWGTAKDDIWAAGNSGVSIQATVFHYDGMKWSKVTAPVDNTLGHPALIAFGPKDVWFGGMKSIWRWDGTWNKSYDGASFTSFFGTPNDLWVASSTSTLEWNGTKWTSQPTMVTPSTYALGGASTQDMWAVGNAGAAAHWDGSSWTKFDVGTTANINAVVGGN
jgi:hypothetical protein